jgi:hypothetical protein
MVLNTTEKNGRARKPQKSSRWLPSTIGNSSSFLIVTLVTTILLCATIGFSQATFSSTGASNIWHISFTWSLAVLRILQGLTTSLTTFILCLGFESIQWTWIEKTPCSLLTFLTISDSTGVMGLLRLGLNKAATRSQRLWPLLRYLHSPIPYSDAIC